MSTNARAAGTLGRHVRSVGFELEGGIDFKDLEKLRRYVSVKGLSGAYSEGEEEGLKVGRKDDGNIEIRLWTRDLSVAAEFLDYAYMECKFSTNYNCGFHVHMTFDDMVGAVELFSSPTVLGHFVDLYKERFSESKYFERLSNEWSGLAANVSSEEHADGSYRPDYKRKAPINVGAFLKHGTIEFRILPFQKTGAEAADSLRWIIETADMLYGRYLGRVDDTKLTRDAVLADIAFRGLNDLLRVM